jgi:hypothetical protein
MFLAVEKIRLSRIFSDILVHHIPSHYRAEICKTENPIFTHYTTISVQPQREKEEARHFNEYNNYNTHWYHTVSINACMTPRQCTYKYPSAILQYLFIIIIN